MDAFAFQLIRRATGALIVFFLLAMILPRVLAQSGLQGTAMEITAEGQVAGPVSGASIEFLFESGQLAGKVDANREGQFRIELAPGDYFYRVSANGFATEDNGRGVRVASTNGLSRLHVGLKKGENTDAIREKKASGFRPVEKVTFRVLWQNEDGTKGSVPEATVYFREVNTTALRTFHVTSGAGGKDSAEHSVVLPKGVWRVSIDSPGYQRWIEPVPWNVEAQTTAIHRDFLLHLPKTKLPLNQGVRGRVSLADGESISGQKPPSITLWFRARKSAGPWPAWKKLDRPGDFEQNLPTGVFDVAATARGYISKIQTAVVHEGTYAHLKFSLIPQTPAPKFADGQEPVPIAPDKKPVEKTILEMTSLRLEITDAATGKPVPDAVIAWRLSGESAQRETSDSLGTANLTFDSLPPSGTLAVLVKHGGYTQAAESIVLKPGENVATIRLTPAVASQPARNARPAERESAKLVDFSTYVVYRKPDGRAIGVSGVQVVVKPAIGEVNEAPPNGITVVSGEKGAFRLRLPPGRYEVTTKPPAGYRSGPAAIHELPASKAYDYIYVEPERNARDGLAQATLWIGAEQDQNGNPIAPVAIPGATVTISRNGKAIGKSLVADSMGRVHVDLQPGQYEITPSSKGYQAQRQLVDIVDKGNYQLWMTRGDQPARVAPAIGTGSHVLTVQVSRAIQRTLPNGQTDEVAVAAAGAIVNLVGPLRQTTYTDQEGVVRVEVPDGSYRIEASADGVAVRQDVKHFQDQTVNLTLRRNQAQPRRAQQGAGILIVRVLNAGQAIAPIRGAEISVADLNGQLIAQGASDERGFFQVSLGDGQYSISATSQSHGVKSQNAEVRNGSGKVSIVFDKPPDVAKNPKIAQPEQPRKAIPKLLRITVNVTKPGGGDIPIPAAGSIVKIIDPARGERLGAGYVDALGNYSLDVPPGNYTVIATLGNDRQQQSVTISDSTVNISLQHKN